MTVTELVQINGNQAVGLRSFEYLLHYRERQNLDIGEPNLCTVEINQQLTLGVWWYGSPALSGQSGFVGEQVGFFFPIQQPSVPEWEFMSPSEWRVEFIGTRQGLANQGMEGFFPALFEQLGEDDWMVILRVNNMYLRGLDGLPMWRESHPVPLVLRVEQGQVIRPCFYVRS